MIRSLANKIFMWHTDGSISLPFPFAAIFTRRRAGEDQTQILQMGLLNGEEI